VRMIAGLPRNPRLLPVLAIPAESPMVRAAILCPKCTRCRRRAEFSVVPYELSRKWEDCGESRRHRK
jgi:hypothetical protein